MAKDSPTVPDGEVNVIPGKDVTGLLLHYIVIEEYRSEKWLKSTTGAILWLKLSLCCCDGAITLIDLTF